MAWPPACTVTCSTRTTCWPLPRWRLGASVSAANERTSLSPYFSPSCAACEGLLGQMRPAEALHGGLVGRHHLRRQHALDDIARADPYQPQQGRRVAELLVVRTLLAPRQTELRTWLAA